MNNTLTSKQLLIIYQPDGAKKPLKVKFYPSQFKGDKGDLLTKFAQYYQRHKNAELAAFKIEPSEEETAE